MDTETLPAGWYTDSSQPAFLRFWNGTEWTSHRKPRPGLPTGFQQTQGRQRFARSRRIA
jgi:hypothetical protein